MIQGASFNMHRYWIELLRKENHDLSEQIIRLQARNTRLALERDRLQHEVDRMKYEFHKLGVEIDETKVI